MLYSDRIRLNAKRAESIDRVDVDVLKDGNWSHVYEGTFSDDQWLEASFAVGVVTQARVRFHVASTSYGLYWELNEFDFHAASVAPPDTTPPVIAPLADVIAEATSAAGAVVTYPPATATDAVTLSPIITYSQIYNADCNQSY